MMFVNDSDPEKDAENFVDDFKDAATIRTCYVVNSCLLYTSRCV